MAGQEVYVVADDVDAVGFAEVVSVDVVASEVEAVVVAEDGLASFHWQEPSSCVVAGVDGDD